MKKFISTLILLLIVMSSFAQNSNLNKRISISFNNISLKEALNLLEIQEGISTAYNSSIKSFGKKITKRYVEKTIDYILKDILQENNLSYKIIAGKVTIYTISEKGKGNISISGYTYDAETGEALIGCTVYSNISFTGTATNNFGYYSLSLPVNEVDNSINYSFIGYKTQTVKLTGENTKININLQPDIDGIIGEVIVRGEKENKQIISSKIGNIKLNSIEINAIPAVGGEVDVLKAVTLLPGIKQGVDGNSGFYVRGGGVDQNLIMLDGVPLYNPYHLWGFLSTFNADAINNMEITKGAFPARFGGRLSSVLDITMKEGNNQKWQTSLTLGLLSAKASVSGPVVKDKSSIMISARRTYADLIIAPILRFQNSDNTTKVSKGYNFTDINLKYNYKLSDNDRLFVSGFYSRDKYNNYNKSITETTEYTETHILNESKGWGNIIASLRWNHVFGPKLFLNTTAYYTSYNYYTNNVNKTESTNINIVPEQENSVEYLSKIEDISIKQDYQFYPNDKNTIRFGFGVTNHKFKPGVNYFFSNTGKEAIENSFNNQIITNEFSLYIEDDIGVSKVIRINTGLHSSAFSVQNSTYYSVQPRLSLRFLINESSSLKIGYSAMTQYIHMLSSAGITQSSDLWVPSTDLIKPQKSHQVSFGSAMLFAGNYLLEIDAYYKKMDNLLEYKNGVSFLTSDAGWEEKVTIGDGYSYGIELFLKKKKGKLTGWLAYTLSWTNRQFDELNNGEEFPYRYDRRHDISIIGIYQLSKKWSLNTSWVFYTGNAVSLPVTSYTAPGYDGFFHSWASFISPSMTEGSSIAATGIIENYETRNNYRLPVYHRLDFSASRKIHRKNSRHELNFGITNVYNHYNPSFYSISHEQDIETGETKVKYISKTLFPVMPTISYKILF